MEHVINRFFGIGDSGDGFYDSLFTKLFTVFHNLFQNSIGVSNHGRSRTQRQQGILEFCGVIQAENDVGIRSDIGVVWSNQDGTAMSGVGIHNLVFGGLPAHYEQRCESIFERRIIDQHLIDSLDQLCRRLRRLHHRVERAANVSKETEGVKFGLQAFAHDVADRDEKSTWSNFRPVKNVTATVFARLIVENRAITADIGERLGHQFFGKIFSDTGVKLSSEYFSPFE